MRSWLAGTAESSESKTSVTVDLVVDAANVVGSRPDGWWRDRAGATGRLLAALGDLSGRTVRTPDGEDVAVQQVVVVLEGAARDAAAPEGVVVRRARRSGDDEIVAVASELGGDGVLVVTSDRGLRARLPDGARVAGAAWLRGLVGY